ncbi:uncharacterized protein LOC108858727 [Raphanus sativus]|uniref:Uncharacterized protein LOC108858727 n=1 Tax=Raphanus sativus TaxID=3726 RepID=A0A6J0NUL5_RAPSA|nr:uncharacterized protein LOC108858727 [Raphanus sativus]
MGNANATSSSARSNGGDSHHQRPSSDSVNSSPSPYLFTPQMGKADSDSDSDSGFNVYAYPSFNSRPRSPGSPARSTYLFTPQIENENTKEDNPSGVDAYTTSSTARPDGAEELSKEAEFHTNVHNLRKMAQELLEKGYNEKGFHVTTMLKYFEKDSKSKDPQDVPYCNWLVGMDSVVTNMGSPYCYWDLSTRINYMNLPLCEDVFLVKKMKLLGVNIMLDNKPKVSGDISFGFDHVKLVAGVGWRDNLESNIELLVFWKHIALKLRTSGFYRDACYLERSDIAVALIESPMKVAAEVSYDFTTERLFSYCIGGAFQTNDFLASVTYWRDSLIGSCVKKFAQFDMGIEIVKPIFSQRCTMTFGICKSKAKELYRMKINNFGVLNGSIERNFWPKALVSVSGQVDLKNMG